MLMRHQLLRGVISRPWRKKFCELAESKAIRIVANMREERAKTPFIEPREELRVPDEHERHWLLASAEAVVGAFERGNQLTAGTLVEVGFPGMTPEKRSQTLGPPHVAILMRGLWIVFVLAYAVKAAQQRPVQSLRCNECRNAAQLRIYRELPKMPVGALCADIVRVDFPWH